MFSGIVEEMGVVHGVKKKPNLYTLQIKAGKVARGTKPGDSISVDGVCLTTTAISKNIFSFDIMLETMKKTTLGLVEKGTKVNLERALKMSTRISGHFVSGHVDNMGTVKDIITGENYTEIRITAPKALFEYIVEKGSVTINGVSLTVGVVKSNYFSVYLIPFTLEVTNLGILKKGDNVNLETDILAKYIINKYKDVKSFIK